MLDALVLAAAPVITAALTVTAALAAQVLTITRHLNPALDAVQQASIITRTPRRPAAKPDVTPRLPRLAAAMPLLVVEQCGLLHERTSRPAAPPRGRPSLQLSAGRAL